MNDQATRRRANGDITRRTTLGAMAGTWALPAIAASQADEWVPTKPVRIVVPIVGSTNDALARLVAPELQRALGQPFIVDNKGGAGGLIGTNEVVRSAPDGHTLLVGFNGPLAINVTLFPKMPYDPLKDLAPITLAVQTPQFLVVNSKVPAKNMQEFLALARKGNMSYGSVSVGSASHLTMEMLKADAHVNITHVPYKGAAPAVTDLIAGQVDAAFLVPGNIQQFVQEGKARLIASTGEKRFASTPEVPTMIEAGFPGFVALSWIGLLAPAGTPKPAIDRYHKELVRIFNQPDVKAKLEKMEFEIVASNPKQFGDWIKAEIPRWGKVIKDNNIKAE